MKPIKLIRMNSRFAKIRKKKIKFSTQRLTDEWSDALDYLEIGLVAINTQNLEKQVKICYLVRGCPI